MTESSQLPILVSGASGQLGLLVLDELLNVQKIPADKIIATTRSPESLADFAKKGVIIRSADFNDPSSLPKAFAGAKRMLIISTTPEGEHVEKQRYTMQAAAINAGIEAGVEHIIYTSAANPEPGTPCFWKAEHYDTELELINSGVTWTILRMWDYPNWHLEEDWMQAINTGEYHTARGAGKANHIWREDCAAACAGALVAPDIAANRRFDVTGPESFAADEIMAMISEITGKKIKVIHCTPEELSQRYIEMGNDEFFIPFLVGYNVAVKGGRYDGITNSLEQLCGKKAKTLREFLVSKLKA